MRESNHMLQSDVIKQHKMKLWVSRNVLQLIFGAQEYFAKNMTKLSGTDSGVTSGIYCRLWFAFSFNIPLE